MSDFRLCVTERGVTTRCDSVRKIDVTRCDSVREIDVTRCDSVTEWCDG